MWLLISEQRRDMPKDMWRTYLFFVTVRVTRVAVKMHAGAHGLRTPSRDTNADLSSTAKFKGPNTAIIIYIL
jgi:hypothetical protein